MKKIFTLSILLISFFSSFSQYTPKSFHHDQPIDIGAILSAKQPSVAMGFSSISEARSIINDIMNVVGQQKNFKVLSTTQVENAAAVMYQGQRYILYNPSFINKLDNIASDKWASISVVAHEIGHHLLGHTLDGRGSQYPKELGADEFSGAVLHKLGASLEQSQLAMKLISSPYASATHPGQRDRLAAIEKGWASTNYQNNNSSDIAIDYPNNRSGYPTIRSTETYPESRGNYPDNRNTYPDSRSNYPQRNDYPNYPQSSRRGSNYPDVQSNRSNGRMDHRRSGYSTEIITHEVKFRRGDGAPYYITSRNNVVKSSGNRLFVVAKIGTSTSPGYPYIIYDEQVQLHVDRRGNIIDETGRNVGYITSRS